MPVIHVHMVVGRTVDQKRRLVEAVTEVLVSEAGATRESVTVVIHESERDNWGQAGLLLDAQ